MMGDDKACDERHDACKLRFGSQADDIKDIYKVKASNKTLYWTLGIFFTLIIIGFSYTQTVASDVKAVVVQVNEVVTKDDMKEYQESMVKAIQEVLK